VPPVTERQVPSSDGVDDADVEVRPLLADGVVGMSTVVCRSELHAKVSAAVATSVSIETVLFTMVLFVRLQFRNRRHSSGRPRFPIEPFF